MQAVFNYGKDVLGDGRISQNELLVYQLFGDVMRPTQCSGAAAFGDASATGATIIGRNLDWDLLQHDDASAMHTVLYIKDGDQSLVMFNILGSSVPIISPVFNRWLSAWIPWKQPIGTQISPGILKLLNNVMLYFLLLFCCQFLIKIKT